MQKLFTNSFRRTIIVRVSFHEREIKHNLFQGEVKFLTGGNSPRTPRGAEQVEFLHRRYSPDERNKGWRNDCVGCKVQQFLSAKFACCFFEP